MLEQSWGHNFSCTCSILSIPSRKRVYNTQMPRRAKDQGLTDVQTGEDRESGVLISISSSYLTVFCAHNVLHKVNNVYCCDEMGG